MKHSVESQSVNRDNRVPEMPPSPVSSDGTGEKGPETGFLCFFAVLDPVGTAKLKRTKHSACLGTFPSVNRLKEHIWRAHSPTHNCPHCRGKTTSKPSEEFKKQHALCRPGGTKITRPLPTLISAEQAENLQKLNQHFKKPNDETIRCEKLWNALFPQQKFEETRFMRSPSTAETDGSQSCPVRENTPPPPRKKDQRQPKTPTSIHRSQNTTPPTTPTATKRPVINSSADIRPKFPVVNVPKGDNFSTKPRTRSGASRDSGLGTEPLSEPGELGALDRQPSPDERQRSPSGIELRGIESRMNQRIPSYPRRVGFEDGDDEMVDDSTAAAKLAVRPNMSPPRYSPASSATYDSRSDYSDGTRGHSDIDMDRSETENDSDEDEEMEEENSRHGLVGAFRSSDTRMSGINFEAAVQLINGRVADIAACDGNFDSDLNSEFDSDFST